MFEDEDVYGLDNGIRSLFIRAKRMIQGDSTVAKRHKATVLELVS